MIARKLKGISMIEVIIVIVISTVLFFFASSLFATRVNTARDNAARQVMADIALVRNQAQQGEGPKKISSQLPDGSELWGEAILFAKNSSTMTSYKLYEEDGIIVSYESALISMPEGLQWIISNSTTCNTGSSSFPVYPPTTNFVSCYKLPGPTSSSQSLVADPIYLDSPVVNNSIMLVFLNKSGQSYIFPAIIASGGSVLSDAFDPSNYVTNRQGVLRLALWYPNSSNDRYFATFDLSIPNNQTLEIK